MSHKTLEPVRRTGFVGDLFRALWAESLKLKGSIITWASFAVCSFMVLVSAGFMWMVMHPETAATLGLLGQKASLTMGSTTPDWAGYLSFLNEIWGIGGLLLSCFILAFVFGREYIQGTVKIIFTLPVSRTALTLAKLILTALWLTLLTAWTVILAVGLGNMLGMGSLASTTLQAALGKLAVILLMVWALGIPVAWIAVLGKGVLAPLAYGVITMIVASVLGHTGWGPWVPWSVLGMYAGLAGEASGLGTGSYLTIAGAGLLGLILLLWHQCRADSTA